MYEAEKRPIPPSSDETATTLLSELAAHLRESRTQLRQEWAQRITKARLLTAMTEEEVFTEATAVYDQYVEALETGTFETLTGVRAQPVRAHHSARRRNGRSRGHRAAAPRRARPLAVREVSDRLREAQPNSRRVRARGEPHRQHGGRRVRARARAHHPRSNRKRSASCPRRCSRCVSGC